MPLKFCCHTQRSCVGRHGLEWRDPFWGASGLSRGQGKGAPADSGGVAGGLGGRGASLLHCASNSRSADSLISHRPAQVLLQLSGRPRVHPHHPPKLPPSRHSRTVLSALRTQFCLLGGNLSRFRNAVVEEDRAQTARRQGWGTGRTGPSGYDGGVDGTGQHFHHYRPGGWSTDKLDRRRGVCSPSPPLPRHGLITV